MWTRIATLKVLHKNTFLSVGVFNNNVVDEKNMQFDNLNLDLDIMKTQDGMNDIKTAIISFRGFFLLVIADKSYQFCLMLFCMMEAKVCLCHFNTFVFGAISHCQRSEEFLEGSDRTISTAALLSAVSGKVYINTEKHPENISSPVQSNRPPLNNPIEEVPGNGENLVSDSCSRKSELMRNCWGM